jgi:hypothetical protein
LPPFAIPALLFFNTLPAIKVNLIARSFAGTLLAISGGQQPKA